MLQAIDIVKSFPSANIPVPVLRGVSMTVEEGEFLAVVGRSGSGKSTMLNVLSSLVRPDSGQVLFQGENVTAAPEPVRNRLRSRSFAMIFQAHHLIPYLTVLENVLLPMAGGLLPVSPAARAAALERVAAVGLESKADRLPRTLSGGEQQRAAIARGLATGARLLFADEPTGSLDAASGDIVMELLCGLNREGLTIVMVTHNPEYARLAGRTVTMREGILVDFHNARQ